MTTVGVDGARAGWCVVSHEGRATVFQLVSSLAVLMERRPAFRSVWIDMPIGLSRPAEGPWRHCDRIARDLLGPARSRVFAPPLRTVLKMETYEAANALSKKLCGAGLSRQSWFLFSKIRELDGLLRHHPEWSGTFQESHPELVFAHWNGGCPLPSKKLTTGLHTRLDLLRAKDRKIARRLVRFLDRGIPSGSLVDDWIDAAALAAAAANDSTLLPFPPPRDATGLPMAYAVPRG